MQTNNLSKFVSILAMSSDGYIAHLDGALPFRDKSEMKHFREMTTNNDNYGVSNYVIMGRKTWESLPEGSRPLRDRHNIILSTTMDKDTVGVTVCRSVAEVIEIVNRSNGVQDYKGIVWVIGGNQIYEAFHEHVSEYMVSVFKEPLDKGILLNQVVHDCLYDTTSDIIKGNEVWCCRVYKKHNWIR